MTLEEAKRYLLRRAKELGLEAEVLPQKIVASQSLARGDEAFLVGKKGVIPGLR